MTVRELYENLDKMIPRALSCEGDNDGLMCCPDSRREARRVLVALDATVETVRLAIEGGYDAIVTHHPLIYKAFKALDDADMRALKLMCLLESDIAVMSFHTRLDAVEGGVNDSFASLLGLTDVEVVENNGERLMRIGTLPTPMNPEDFAKKVKEVLNAPFVQLGNAGKSVSRVALLGGSGDDYINAAINAGADTYVSGALGYHSLTDAREMGINLIEAGHFYTEDHVCQVLKNMIASIDDTIVCDVRSSTNIAVL